MATLLRCEEVVQLLEQDFYGHLDSENEDSEMTVDDETVEVGEREDVPPTSRVHEWSHTRLDLMEKDIL